MRKNWFHTPDTDCQYITDAEFSYLVNQIPAYQGIIGQPFEVANQWPTKALC